MQSNGRKRIDHHGIPVSFDSHPGLIRRCYFRVPSIVHYLIVLTARRGVIHHRRAFDDGIDTRILSSGKIELNPPGIAIDIDAIYAR